MEDQIYIVNMSVSAALCMLTLGMIFAMPTVRRGMLVLCFVFLCYTLQHLFRWEKLGGLPFLFIIYLTSLSILWTGILFLADSRSRKDRKRHLSPFLDWHSQIFTSLKRLFEHKSMRQLVLTTLVLITPILVLTAPFFLVDIEVNQRDLFIDSLLSTVALAFFTFVVVNTLQAKWLAWAAAVACSAYAVVHLAQLALALFISIKPGESLFNIFFIIAALLKVALFLSAVFAERDEINRGTDLINDLIERLGEEYFQQPKDICLEKIMMRITEIIASELCGAVRIRLYLGFSTPQYAHPDKLLPYNMSINLISGDVRLGAVDLEIPRFEAEMVVSRRRALEQAIGEFVLQSVRLALSRILAKISEADSHEHWLRSVQHATKEVGLTLRAVNLAGTQVSIPSNGLNYAQLRSLALGEGEKDDLCAIGGENQHPRYILVPLLSYPGQGLAFECDNRCFGGRSHDGEEKRTSELRPTLPWRAFLEGVRDIGGRCARNGELGSSLVDHACRLRLKFHKIRNDLYESITLLKEQLEDMPPSKEPLVLSMQNVLKSMKESAKELKEQVAPVREHSECSLYDVLTQLQRRYQNTLTISIDFSTVTNDKVGLPHYTLLCVLCNLCDNTRRIYDKGADRSRAFIELYKNEQVQMKLRHEWEDPKLKNAFVGAQFEIVMPYPFQRDY